MKMRMFTSDGYYSIDCHRRTAVYLEREKYYAGTRSLRAHQEAGRRPTSPEIFDSVGAKHLSGIGGEHAGDPLEIELRHFLHLAATGRRSEVLGPEDGIAAIEIAERILEEVESSGPHPKGLDLRSQQL
jgi:predicted dehydrogenase